MSQSPNLSTRTGVSPGLPRRFALHRRYDVTGVSGTGVIAYGTRYPTGRVTLMWCCSTVQSIGVYDDVAEVEQVHGHGGLTEIRWIDRAAPAVESRRTVMGRPA